MSESKSLEIMRSQAQDFWESFDRACVEVAEEIGQLGALATLMQNNPEIESMKGSEIVHLGGIIAGNAKTLEGYLPLFNGMNDWLSEVLRNNKSAPAEGATP